MIDKMVPIPKNTSREAKRVYREHKGENKYPWRSCTEIGDSFVPNESEFSKVWESARKFCRRNKEFNFEVHKLESGEIRVWRV